MEIAVGATACVRYLEVVCFSVGPLIEGLLYMVAITIELVDSISRDGPDTPIYIIHYKKQNNLKEEKFNAFKP